MRATSAPNTFIFTDLLQAPQIQALASSDEFAPYLSLLQIFSYGTYSSYTSTPGLPDLNDAQRLKLRQLSLLTLARKDAHATSNADPTLSYASLQRALDLPSRQSLEELVISAIYAGLLKAQLNPKDSLVQINSVSPLRDVAPTAIDGLLSRLEAWAERCDMTLQNLEEQMNNLRAGADRRAAQEAARAAEMARLLGSEQKGGKTSSAPYKPVFSAATAGVALSNPLSSLRPRHETSLHNPSYPSPNRAGTGGGSNANTKDTSTTTDQMMKNSMLTVGGGNSFLLQISQGDGVVPNSTGAPATQSSAVKRASEQSDEPATGSGSGESGVTRDGANDGDDPGGKKRKLQE
jgi:COP9 signalosome complex subunit 7